ERALVAVELERERYRRADRVIRVRHEHTPVSETGMESDDELVERLAVRHDPDGLCIARIDIAARTICESRWSLVDVTELRLTADLACLLLDLHVLAVASECEMRAAKNLCTRHRTLALVHADQTR